MKRSAMIISIVITTFILGIVGGVVKATSNSKESAAVAKLQATMQTREELYSQTIQEANARINQANEQLQQVNDQKVKAEQALASIPTPEPKQTGISSKKAVELAMKAVGLNDPSIAGKSELVSYNGQEAFEVELANGDRFYLSANNGDVLYNSVIGGPGSIIDEQGAVFSAVTYMKGGQVYSVEKTTYEEKEAYLVTFVTGEQVYVDLAGQVVAYVQVQSYPVYTNVSTTTKKAAAKNNNSSHEGNDDGEGDD